MSDEQINAWDDLWNAEKQALTIEKQQVAIKCLRDALETLLKVYEDETNIMDKVPVRIQQARTEAWKAIEETR